MADHIRVAKMAPTRYNVRMDDGGMRHCLKASMMRMNSVDDAAVEARKTKRRKPMPCHEYGRTGIESMTLDTPNATTVGVAAAADVSTAVGETDDIAAIDGIVVVAAAID